MVKAIIALGSNLGDRAQWIARAVHALKSVPGISVVKESPLIPTAPIGPVQKQPEFLNGAVLVETNLPPIDLLDALKGIESTLGRIHRERWGPREIDLDILTYGDQSVNEPRLRIPHPEISNRPFLTQLMAAVTA
jgi:2-amino-4-hydroxy-6-hydroxymethyldihydropteridine diphosphokinase